jgi:hypothetical protein
MIGHMWLIKVILKLPLGSLFFYGSLLLIVGFTLAACGNFLTTILNMTELFKILVTSSLSALFLVCLFMFLRQYKIIKRLKVGLSSI